MVTTVQLKSVETLGDDATVCDFDELPDSAKEDLVLAAQSGDSEVTVGSNASSTFGACDIVRFTAYYRVTTE